MTEIEMYDATFCLQNVPGVHAVLTAEDVPGVNSYFPENHPMNSQFKDMAAGSPIKDHVSKYTVNAMLF